MNWPAFFTRLGSAVVFCLVMMAGLLWNDWAFLALLLLIQFLCLREFLRLSARLSGKPPFRPLDLILLLSGAGIVLCAGADLLMSGNTKLLAVFLCLPALILLVTFLAAADRTSQGLYSMMGMLYIILPCVLLVYMRSVSTVIPLALILMLWMNDTMAYLVGSFIGRTPFSEISPKKTWEGTAGGVILTIAGAAIWGCYTPYYNMADWMMLALCASVAGTAGDLLESKLKRLADVKDSGTMMPGHGGALDRFDSLLVAAPFACCYVYLFMEPLPIRIF